MFSKKLDRANYSSGVGVMTLCCFGKPKAAREDSDEVPTPTVNGDSKILKEKEEEGDNADVEEPLTQAKEEGEKGPEDAVDGVMTYDQIEKPEEKDIAKAVEPEEKLINIDNEGNPKEEKKKKKKLKTKVDENGAAYQYEESSSDSEDDVQRHYQNSVARANSVRSGKSSRTKQTASSRHNSTDALRTRGSREDVEAGEAGSYNAESDEELHRSRNHLPASTPNSQSATGASLTFENQAFMADASQGVAAAGSGSASDRAQSTERLTSDVSSDQVRVATISGGLVEDASSPPRSEEAEAAAGSQRAQKKKAARRGRSGLCGCFGKSAPPPIRQLKYNM